jgi:hypothetical protein
LDWKDCGDSEKSTDAALKHFLNNITIVHNRCKSEKIALSESDMWKYAFWMYNGRPGLVNNGFSKGNHNPNNYGDHYRDGSETANYVPRILAIRTVLQEKIRKGKISFK